MYSDKLVIAVKHQGRILREHGDTVHVPFGSEYSILIKNKNSVRALVRVEIDGVDVTEGTRLIVPANGSMDLERFIKDNNMDQGNRFKFIERTKKIEDGPRGIKIEDGLVRVEFEFEREPLPMKSVDWDKIYQDQLARDRNTWSVTKSGGAYSLNAVGRDGLIGQVGLATPISAPYSANNMSIASATGLSSVSPTGVVSGATHDSAPVLNDVGITVPGSVSDQKFEQGAWFPTDGVKHVLVLKLLGEVEGKVVEKPITVKTKPTCATCGIINKANAKFCRECGTGLTIV